MYVYVYLFLKFSNKGGDTDEQKSYKMINHTKSESLKVKFLLSTEWISTILIIILVYTYKTGF